MLRRKSQLLKHAERLDNRDNPGGNKKLRSTLDPRNDHPQWTSFVISIVYVSRGRSSQHLILIWMSLAEAH